MKSGDLSTGFIGISSFSIPYFSSTIPTSSTNIENNANNSKVEPNLMNNSISSNIVGDNNFNNINDNNNNNNNNNKLIKYYTKEEISKHCTKNDFWTIFRDKVYDLTNFWKDHPGGDIILEGAGKDITMLFDDIGHSFDAELLLKKYYIGELKLK